MKKYKINIKWMRPEIEEIDVIRETEKQVVMNSDWRGRERREAKVSEFYEYHNTWIEAYGRLLELASKRIVVAEKSLYEANQNYSDIVVMKHPETPK